ncbi:MULTISPECIES: hypothetical protein [Parabacteroides]|uniref:hypothetical protein n=1 Tax=Parabacteroides leei TaxID=2939491 RepID=UPI001E449F03|nr:hypothetical protein [Parabacteroides goldsteinii]
MVIDAGLNPGYVLDQMEYYEIDAILESLKYQHRDSWEQTRMVCYVLAQSNSTKSLKPTDIIRLPWDDENNNKAEPKDTYISAEDIERLKKKAEQFIKSK